MVMFQYCILIKHLNMNNCHKIPQYFNYHFLLLYLHMSKHKYIKNYLMYKWILKIIFLKQQAMRNRAVSITYRGWLGHHCVLLLSPARLLKHMSHQDHCDAVVPPSHPFCNKKDVNDRMIKNSVD